VAKNQKLVGTLFVMMSSLGFSIGPSLAKHAYDSGSNPLGVMTVRFTIASLIMLILRQIILRKEPLPTLKIILEMFAIGTLGITTVSFAYFLAIESIDTGLAIVLWYCNPLIVVLMSWIFLKKRPTRSIAISLVFTMVGIFVTVGQFKSGSNGAIALIMFSAFMFSVYLLTVSRALKKVNLLTGVTFINIGAAIGYWLICLVLPFGLTVDYPSNTLSWLLITAFSVFGTVVPFLFSYAGMKRVGPSMLAVITTLEPVLAITMGIIFLNELLTIQKVIGAALVIGALVLLSILDRHDEVQIAHQ
jgi:drug/metabolite transporter (DMT)-like permease